MSSTDGRHTGVFVNKQVEAPHIAYVVSYICTLPTGHVLHIRQAVMGVLNSDDADMPCEITRKNVKGKDNVHAILTLSRNG